MIRHNLSTFAPVILLIATFLGAPLLSSQALAQGKTYNKASLKKRLDEILANKSLKKAKVGVHILDLDSDKTIYEKNADERFNPASNIKLVTAAAVLDKFGPNHTFTTELWGKRGKNGIVQGNLYLKGNGDPFLEWSHLLEMAERLQRRGIKEIKGDLVVDDTAFDDAFLPPAFEQKKETAAYRASVSSVAALFGASTIVVSPTEPGEPTRVSFDPPNEYMVVDNRSITVKDRKEANQKPLTLEIKPDAERTRVILGGKTHPRGGATVRKRIDNPSLHTGYLMKSALKSMGIKVQGEVRRGKRDGGSLLAKHSSYTLPYLVSAMQKWSNNFMAEMLFKSLDLGEDSATWKGAQNRAKRFLNKKVGLEPESYKLTNGSGLYNANEFTPRQFTALLAYMDQRSDLRPEFEASMAIAGKDGTLRKRMRDEKAEGVLRGKTGTLNRVVTLTGIVHTAGGRKLAFSILFNKTKGGAWSYRKIQDEIGNTLSGYKPK